MKFGEHDVESLLRPAVKLGDVWSPWQRLIRHKTRSCFWRVRDACNVMKLDTHMTGSNMHFLMWFFGSDMPTWLNSAPYKFSTKQPPKLVWPTSMKLGTHMHHWKTYKKASCSHVPNPTGSRPIWIWRQIGRFALLVLFLSPPTWFIGSASNLACIN